MMLIKKQNGITLAAGASMLVLILDSRLALQSAYEGVILCIRTVIPSLFPFLVISGIITSNLSTGNQSRQSRFEKCLGIPSGGKILVMLGFLGGYPSGAQNVNQLYKNNMITKEGAERMLPICNNAGPAFIFGIISTLFTTSWTPWVLWCIQIIATLILAILLPHKSESMISCVQKTHGDIINAVQTALRTIAYICGWVILFRIVQNILERRIFHILPQFIIILISGIFEITNGVISLSEISNEATRFVVVSVFLSIGGLCILLQTKAVAKDLNLKTYCIAKGLHSLISLFISVMLTPFLFHTGSFLMANIFMISTVIFAMIFTFTWIFKKTVAIQQKVLYNDKKSESEVLL